MRNLFFALVLSMLAGSCVNAPPINAATIIDVEFGYWNSYSSASGLLARKDCRNSENKFQVPVKLSLQAMESIGSAAEESGFFAAQSPPPRQPVDPEAVQISAPCSRSTLGITFKGRRNVMSWSCNSVGATPPLEAQAAFSQTLTALQPYLSQLPEQQCVLR